MRAAASTILMLLAILLAPAAVRTASAELLGPYKDDLFTYPKALETGDGGAYLSVDYRSERDINQRDEIPEKRVYSRYVDLAPRRVQQDLNLVTDVGRIPHVAVGEREGAKFIVVYVHGQGGSRLQGMNDFTFGGNFNRIKNLAARNGGLYLTVDFSNFEAAGASQVSHLISTYAGASPRAKVFVACGSMGGRICWALAADKRVVPKLGGLLLLGSHWDNSFLRSPAFQARVPVYFGHGGADKVFPVEKQEAFFRSILAKDPNYPARFVRFETGSHGTPIRMVDWRHTLNWMASASR